MCISSIIVMCKAYVFVQGTHTSYPFLVILEKRKREEETNIDIEPIYYFIFKTVMS